jgi:hypothetical protein
MVKCVVFFAVRTEFLNTALTSFDFKGLNITTADHFYLTVTPFKAGAPVTS